MNDKYLKKLEFYKIIENLSKFCHTYKGKELALSLLPSNKKDIVVHLLEETTEAVNLCYRNGKPNFYDFLDIDLDLKSLEVSSSLSPRSLLNLANIFKLSQDLKDYFFQDFLNLNEYPILQSLFSNLYSNKDIVSTILHSIIDENTIDDNASKDLLSIRKQKRNLEQDIRSKLNNILHSSSYSKYIQENIVTIRNDRFVIPIKEEYRSQIKGFVHDVSNAGSTVFVEPISVFDLNNELNAIKIAEQLEIEKILKDLSKLFYPFVKELKLNVDLIGQLDFIFAKASFAKAINAFAPDINDKKEIHLKNARHPLIDANKVVPMSLDLGDSFSVLLITGPNTGGKTVALKTVGLLVCMACSGLHIPCDESSSVFVFDYIFADIGDDQSIVDSLSTFSSHMSNIIEIINNATKDSLILVDELGSGTDPLEGSRLAISILDFIKSTGSLCIATTHYQELKQYALVTDGFKNACVEFDVSTLSPTYRLLIGIPGKSNAFEISKKLGLDEAIIRKAQSLMSSNEIDFENLLKNIYDDKFLIEKEKNDINKELNQITNLRKALETEKSNLINQQHDFIYNAKQEARKILLNAKNDANEIIKKMNQISNVKELERFRISLNKKIKNLKIENENIPIEMSKDIFKPEELIPNTKVFVISLHKEGIVLSSHVSKSNEVQVQIGNLKMNVSVDNLAKPISHGTKVAVSKNINYSDMSKSKNISTEINVIGMNVEEAIFVIDKFLDDCSLAKLHIVRIVHGKGTGKLRNGIHDFLKKSPYVKSFRVGSYGEGEIGVTVVELR